MIETAWKGELDRVYQELRRHLEDYHTSVIGDGDPWDSELATALTRSLRHYHEVLVAAGQETPDGLDDLAVGIGGLGGEREARAPQLLRACIRMRADYYITDLAALREAALSMGMPDSDEGEVLDMVLHLWEEGDADLLREAGLEDAGSIASAVLVELALDEMTEVQDPFSVEVSDAESDR